MSACLPFTNAFCLFFSLCLLVFDPTTETQKPLFFLSSSFVVMPVEDVPNFGPMMASLSPLLKRRVSHLKQARESRIGAGSTGTQEQELLLTGPSLVERSIQVKPSQSPESQRSLHEYSTGTVYISDELMLMMVQRSFHHIPTRLHKATRHIQSFKKLPPPLIKVACGSAFSRGQLLPGADWETNDLPLFKQKLITHFPNAPKGCSEWQVV